MHQYDARVAWERDHNWKRSHFFFIFAALSTSFSARFLARFLACFLAYFLEGCANRIATQPASTPSPSPSPTSTTPASARAAKIIFKLSSGGSFDSPPSNGTAPGSGLQAARVFNLDGTLLASGGPGSASWPTWLSNFEVGISGPANTGSLNPSCAKFADSSEANAANCILGTAPACPASGSPTPAQCGTSAGQFRVSEVDCSLNSPITSPGTGSSADGVYFRATFNRSNSALGSSENILVTVEYAASAVNSAPANPRDCFSNGIFSPESCSDFTWRAYLKHSSSEVVQPYLLFIPPTYASVIGSTSTPNSGTSISTKQFVLPLAGDATLSIFQLSRTGSHFPGDPTVCGTPAYLLKYYCTANQAATGGTPLCAGVVFYSISLTRI